MISPADDIRRKMQNVRHELKEDVDDIAESTREMTNWQTYVKRYPWACMGAAFAAGFAVVPKQVELVAPDADTLVKLAKKHKLVVEANPKPQSRGGVTSTLLSLMGTMAMRGAVAYAGNYFGQHGGEQIAAEAE
ncbi:hypothetical protein CA54_33760 [Symmachiella macrocystis]|uniref:DUF3618 domain-containing protein n=1 Tax=Symmachiella macrocystis TaxID=2527985 RepID=A0A5C6BUZ4_9PLAN|nr:hypothetical protein [Symmachiella macrocystis]TWU14509.1 hypothetical protein CA54_33760 [Symmachiella macrocystis]